MVIFIFYFYFLFLFFYILYFYLFFIFEFSFFLFSISLAFACFAGHYSGLMIYIVDMGGDYSQNILSISNTFASSAGFIANFACGIVLKSKKNNFLLISN